MDWATRRRFIIFSIAGAVIVALAAVVLIASLYKTPSCSDGIENQGEQGVDCGGPCPYLCTAQEAAPVVLFTQALSGAPGRTDVLAYVENPNAAAAKAVPYTISLYDVNQVLVQKISGTVDLPPSSTVPVYVPGVASGNTVAATAFLAIDPSVIRWYAYHETRALPQYGNDAKLGGTVAAPRVSATVRNPGTVMLTNVHAVIAVRDAQGDIIAASSTIVPAIAPQTSAALLYTWNKAFPAAPASFEIVPFIALP